VGAFTAFGRAEIQGQSLSKKLRMQNLMLHDPRNGRRDLQLNLQSQQALGRKGRLLIDMACEFS
jgi:hypothetical protein